MLENAPQLEEICVMVQWEVAERFAASTRSKAYGIPSVKTQYWADVKILGKVSPNVFLPAPKVDSAILKIRRKAEPLAVDYQKFSLLVQTAFRQRRKMLRKSLIQLVESSHFSTTEINPQARPEELSVEDWIKLTKSLSTGRRK
jgi:16S rRNA (adenine1518-N6/adenine1519-N6)-dimethyltransferase